MQPVNLSKADSLVLQQVFDPESAPDKAEVIVDPILPADRNVQDAALLASLRAQEREAVTIVEQHERSQRKDAQMKDAAFKKALAILDSVVADHPNYASAHNNRAQLRRWRFGDRHLLCRPAPDCNAHTQQTASAVVDDLKTAVALASPTRQTDAVSPAQGRLLAQAYTQLAAVYHAAAKTMDEADVVQLECKDCKGWSKEAFEDEASRLFYLGGLYGNEVAKALAVHTNPHAKLCGSIVQEAMRKELALT